MTQIALVTGITGQDGAYLARSLLNDGYKVYGAARRASTRNLWRLDDLGIADKVEIVYLDLLEFTNLLDLVRRLRPAEIYNLAAQSFVGVSFEQPLYTSEANALGVLRLLEVIRAVDPKIRFYQASTSEMFGMVHETPQRESTPFHPRSPYGVAKTFAHYATQNYRESWNMHAVSGILFNHESPLRGLEFVTRKISATLAQVAAGHDTVLGLGNIDVTRDWGFAGDYVEAMRMMVAANTARDYVVATGQTHTVREFVKATAQALGLDLAWEGDGATERAVNRKTGKPAVVIDAKFHRPAEVFSLQGDPARIRADLGWKPRVDFAGLVEMMAKADFDRVKAGRAIY